MTAENIILIVLIVTSLCALIATYRRDLMMLQLNSYRNDRYTRWFNSANDSTSYPRIGAAVSFFIILVHNMPLRVTGVVAALIMAWIAVALTCRKYKKPLVMTRRAWRIFITMLVLTSIVAAVVGLTVSNALLGIAAVIVCANFASPAILLTANYILRPVESRINARYRDEAIGILRSMPSLKIIGITGSYGKTSTKHYLHRILSEKYDVLMTPGSFNTPMGVIRTIREYMKPYNEVFICEMGAKQVGDIKEICDIVHPRYGIITAVGEQHLESFKSIENVQRTKFELADSLPADGLAIVNNDYPMIASRPVDNCECLRYAVASPEGSDYVACDIDLDATGTSFTVKGSGLDLRLHTRLVGECNISNLTAAVVMAHRLGVSSQQIAYAVASIEQVEHRLNMKRTAAGVTIIDDAFNSNPTGSRMALEVLGSITTGKRIVVTPGMIELGDRQYDLNKELGRHCAANADIVIIVNEVNRQAISDGLAEAGVADDKVRFAPDFATAQAMLASMLAKGDAVLYENDLPDTFK